MFVWVLVSRGVFFMFSPENSDPKSNGIQRRSPIGRTVGDGGFYILTKAWLVTATNH